MYKTVLITGGAGFIGSHFARYYLETHPKSKIINIDILGYAGNLENLRDIEKNPRYKFYQADIGDFQAMSRILKKEKPEVVVNFAAESDNNKAISSPIDFARTNALGTAVLLEAIRQSSPQAHPTRFHHISTCEVFGQLPLDSKSTFSEQSPFEPRTPYNASKAAANHIVNSYFCTFGLPVTISHACNNYGSHQFPEKVIPVFAVRALQGSPLPVFKSSGNKREWIHVLDHCRGIDLVLKKGRIGESYNVGSGVEKTIDQLADNILEILGKERSIKKIVPDRPGHDTRYLLNSSKIRKLGWKPQIEWESGLRETVEWYKNNSKWWKPLLKKSHSKR
ncbi:dTDP-glucose 4,6-dehydratase [Candidatus Giovannonibacteria bacterium RIFCSPHIGHO2_01_FULL_45_24]|uniref:dTDP-glucose 4,6-dehydratase n=2 Tax=Candidatus Yanofskyibacteriota TaxID=1752733 RepID=A0A1F8H0U5_9BACT|nr:MAG: dTDP-glucose 4,6-dehydratase [Candidatus Giovannonibacteria bacterium RIFCSPHIGHO2_01_FULL_45_24]OGN13674.1 MAG: dTDP-glucose 4,6-dehydratase [Candidatus Yanofskybacteria bacterium RIFCSPHIGHO2_02_FULL_43_15c]OGN31305.1 MAG: dTDP-glucose 4,6-dehydratase [Candidatus Yanofskybacteria bacterium RIFCSPLOWO2_02_FULL_43_10b]